MMRPEWNVPRSGLSGRLQNTAWPLLKSRSTTSLVSTSSEISVDSTLHKVRNIFVQNLSAQMAYVVEKMSSRNVPASVVTFCGKATAYAFFYCDGVAEMLIRLWAVPQQTIKRVVRENEIGRNTDLKTTAERLAGEFPLCLQNLAFSSYQQTVRMLRAQPKVPLANMNIPWYGPWVGRWAGRDTDLFYIFTKFYHNLICNLLPDPSTPQERLCAPGYVLVHAQILTLLDSTIKRTIAQPPLNSPTTPLPLPLEADFAEEADVSASVIPLPPKALLRSMAENRLILFLRDSLSESSLMSEKARAILAKAFEVLLKATVRRISLFDHDSCFILCDFLDELIAILARYDQSSASTFPALDWPFWLSVCRQMMESQNIMTEIRLYAFLYSLWGTIISDEDRKRQVCLDWLLDQDLFQRQFNHWCPMVRAYFMRLLCWRIGRLNGSSSIGDQ